jgi:hypothetical protein
MTVAGAAMSAAGTASRASAPNVDASDPPVARI